MKKLIVVLNLLIIFSSVSAQKGKVTRALNLKNSGELGQALETIQMAVDPENGKSEKSIKWVRTWEVRGEIYQAIYQSKDEKFKTLCNDPLAEALNSYNKALGLDASNKFSKSLKVKMTLLVNDFQDQAINAFNNNDYKKALSSFEKVLEINSLPFIKVDNPDAIDTVIIFNTGLAAQNAKDFDKAIKYYNEASQYGYKGAQTYIYIANAFKQKQDTLSALESLKQGFAKYQDDNEILAEVIQTFIDLDRGEEAMKYLKVAIKQSPNNTDYYCVLGDLYEKNDDEIHAIELYEKAIRIDPELFLAFYNLGVIYYNKGVEQFYIANKVPANDNINYQIELKKTDMWWKKSLQFMEKCHEINPSDINTLETLKTLYYRLKQLDEYNAILEKLE